MTKASIPLTMETSRYRAARTVDLPDGAEIPLIKADAPDEKKVQQRYIAHVKVFNLSDEKQLGELEVIWQKVCDQEAIVSEYKTDFNAVLGAYQVFLRWSDFEYRAPKP